MTENPLVSIIIPTKNSEAPIERCLRSIKKQTYENIEIVVVDNYSKDKTCGIAKKLGAKVYLSGPERSAQVNFGVKIARGKYVYAVGSDFLIERTVIEECLQKCEGIEGSAHTSAGG